MVEALRDPSVQTLIAIAALVVTIVSIVVSRRNRKRLSYRVVFQQRLLSVEEDLAGRVQVTFDGNPVQDVRMILIYLRNSGNVPIEESDYIQPLGFRFGKEARILSAEVVKTKPENMQVSIEADRNGITLKPDVFNGGDALALKVLLTGNSEVRPEGRVKGVSRLQKSGDKSVMTMIIFFVYTFAISGLGTLALLHVPGLATGSRLFVLILLVIAALAVVPFILFERRFSGRDL